MGLIDKKDKMDYWNVTYGALRKKTDEANPEAIRREYTTKTGETKVIYELVKEGVAGFIDEFKKVDGEHGSQLIITVRDGIEQFAITMPFDSAYARTFLERVLGVDPSKEVELKPYSFKNEKGKTRSGITIYQSNKKLNHYFKAYDADGNFMEWKDGYPHFEEGMESEDWKIVAAQQSKFLRQNVLDNYPVVDSEDTPAATPAEGDEEQDKLPF